MWQKIVLPGLLIATSMGLFAPPARAQVLSLETAVQTALEQNERIQQYGSRENQRRYDERATLGNFLPQLRLETSYTHLNDPLQIDLEPLRQALIQLEAGNQVEFANLYGTLQGRPPLTPAQRQTAGLQAIQGLESKLPPFRENLKDQNYPTATLTFVQPLFLGGKLLAARRAALAEEAAAGLELDRVRQEVTGEVFRNYLSVVFLQNVVRTRQDVLAGVRQHRERAMRLNREGLIPTSDVKRAEVAVAEAERNLYDDESRLALARAALSYTLGNGRQGDTFILADSLHFIPVGDSLDVFLSRAIEDQPALAMIARKQQAAAQKVAVEKSEYLPQIAAFGKYELFQDNLSALEPEWAVGLKAGFTLFSGFQRSRRLQSARSLVAEVGHMQEYARDQVELLVTMSYREMRRAEQRYEKLEASLVLADENLRLADRRYETGLGTALEVIDARLLWEKAKIDRLNALYDYYGALNTLYGATGHPDHMLTLWKTIE